METRGRQPGATPSRARPSQPEARAPNPGTLVGTPARWGAFRVWSAVTALAVTLVMSFGLLELGLMWLPDATLLSLIDDLTAADLVHRSHFNSIGIVSWALVLALVVQLRRPERRVAAMLQAVGITLAGTVLYGLSGSLTDWLAEEIVLLVPVLGVAVLHPRARHLVRRPSLDRVTAALAGAAAVPWLVFAVGEAQLQWRNVAGDQHAEMEHWATSALMAVAIVLAAVIGATDHAGWRMPACFAAFASIEYGAHSLVFPDRSSAASVLWAVAAIAWGCAYALAAVHRSRRSDRPGSGPAGSSQSPVEPPAA